MSLAFTYDSHAQDNASANNIVLTTTIAYPVGSRIIVYGNIRGGPTVSSFSDSRGNSYAVDQAAGGGAIGSALCATALQIGDTITVQFSGSGTGHGSWAGYITGQDEPAKDKSAGTTGSGTSPANSGNTATTTVANEILIGSVGIVGAAATQDASYTNIDNFTISAGAVTQIAGYRIVSATGAYNYAPTYSGSHSWGSIVVSYKQQQPITITPSVGALAITGQAPVVTVASGNVTIAPSVGSLTFTGQAPSTSIGQTATPSAGALTFTGQAPVVTQGGITVTPSAGAFVFTGESPVVTATDNHAVAPAAGLLTFTGEQPVIRTDFYVAPDAGAFVFVGEQPSVTATDNQTVTPDAGNLTFTGEQPDVTATANLAIVPSAGSFVFTGEQPAVTQTTNAFIAPDAGSLVFVGEQPGVSVFIRLYPGPNNIVVPRQVTNLTPEAQVTAIAAPRQTTALLAPRQVRSITPQG